MKMQTIMALVIVELKKLYRDPMTLGVLARIDGDNYEIVAVQSNSGAYVPGAKYALGDSLSRQVCEQRKIIAEIDIDYTASNPPHPL